MKLQAIIVLTIVSFLSMAKADPVKYVVVQGTAQRGSGPHEILIKGNSIASNGISLDIANQTSKNGFSASYSEKTLGCTDGIYVIMAGEGNFLPSKDGSEVYFVPSVLSFYCNSN